MSRVNLNTIKTGFFGPAGSGLKRPDEIINFFNSKLPGYGFFTGIWNHRRAHRNRSGNLPCGCTAGMVDLHNG